MLIKYLFAACFLIATAHARTPPSVPDSPGIGPAKLEAIRLSFGIPESGPATLSVKPGETIPSFKAVFKYSGTGMVSGRWELITPADSGPDDSTILPESQMPASERDRPRMLEALDTFSVQLPPTSGTYTLTGPGLRADRLTLTGTYRIALRVEAVSSSANVTQRRLPYTPLRLLMLGGPTSQSIPTVKIE